MYSSSLRQERGKFLLPLFDVLFRPWVSEARLPWGGPPVILGPSVQMLTPSRNTLPDTPGNHVSSGLSIRVKLIHKINHQTHHNLSWKKRRKQKRGRMSNNCEKNVKHTLLECDTINTRRKRPSGSQEEEIVREVTIRAHRRVPSRCPLHWLIYIGTNN